MRQSAADHDGLLRAGEIYLSGQAVSETMQGLRLPVTAFAYGWHPVENWGSWASQPEARLTAATGLGDGARALVALRLHAPPGSESAACVVEIGGVESAPRPLTQVSQWQTFEGEIRGPGMLAITLRAVGAYGRPDSRELFAGLEAIAFCPADDAEARARLTHKLRPSLALRARRAVSTVKRALRRSDGAQRLAGVRAAALTFETAREPRPSDPLPTSAGPAWEPPAEDDMAELSPEMAGRPLRELFRHHAEGFELRQLGREERTHWGLLPTLRGVDSLRGFCIAREPVAQVEVAVNGFSLHRGPVRGYDMPYELDKRVRKYVFNVWCDVTSLPFGRYELEFRAFDAAGVLRFQRRLAAVIDAPRDAGLYDSSDRFVALPPHTGSIEDAVNALPSEVRPARRAFFEQPIRNVMVMRTDQLGDLVCSIPALRRLRQLFPQARLVGLLSGANADLARSLGLFDEVLVVDFPEDLVQRNRVMPRDRQLELKRRLAPYRFDLAIDLSGIGVSRPALLLSGARYTLGFGGGEFRWLSASFDAATRDPVNGHERVPHTNKLVAMIDWLAAISASQSEVIARGDLGRETLAPFGLDGDARFVVLHTGARLKFSRWPHYGELARLILARTELSVVMMADDGDCRAALPDDLMASPRFQLIDRRLSFDQFDALMSFCAGFVGNDSGPKHLASLRGAKVVSIHLARNNWNEWGQENSGYIVSRRVPCAGCSIHYDPEDCGKDFACLTHVRAHEVYDALTRAMAE